MAYDYIKRTYDVDPKVGARVQHTVTKRFGKIMREKKSAGNYVQVMFDGRGFSVSCHPTELDYAPVEHVTDAAVGGAAR